MGAKRKTVSFVIDPELLEKVKRAAEDDNRNLSNFIETALIWYLKRGEDK